MHLRKLIVVLLLLTAGGLQAAGPELAAPSLAASVGLRQCYAWALSQSEDLKIRQEDVAQSKAKGHAALASALPYADWQFTDTWQDPKGVEQLERQGFAGFVQKEQVESKFSLTQTLFSGLREFSAVAGFKHETTRQGLQLERASLELFEKTANAFYAVVDNETNRENTRATWTLAEDRVKELKGFLRLGKSRDSELYTAQAHAAALKAKLDQIEAAVNSSREELAYLTGHDFTQLVLVDEIAGTPVFGTLDEALKRAKNRRDIRAQREDAEVKRLQVRYERGFYWPRADLTGNYYTRRPTYLDAIDWDVVLSLKVPFFQGGAVSAQVNEANSAYRQSSLMLQEMERYTVYIVREIYGDLAGAVHESQSLDEAAKAAQLSHDALRKEYRLGLVTNLDVLEALDFLQSQKSASDSARLKVKKLFIQLNVALDQMPL